LTSHPEIEKAHLVAEHMTLTAVIEIAAMMIHGSISPTTWLQLTTQQRNSTRRKTAALINEAAAFWESEERKAQAPL